MKISLENKYLGFENFTYREIGFGKSVELPLFSWEAEIERGQFIELFEPIYSECIEELKHDDVVTGEFCAPHEGATDYPNLIKFINDFPSDFIDFFKTYFIQDLLEHLFGGNREWKYVINSLETINLDRDNITLGGKAYMKVN